MRARASEMSLGEGVRVEPVFSWRLQDVRHARTVEYLPTGSGTNPRERYMLQTTK